MSKVPISEVVKMVEPSQTTLYRCYTLVRVDLVPTISWADLSKTFTPLQMLTTSPKLTYHSDKN